MAKSLTIVADANMPEVAQYFGPLGEVRLIAGREIQRHHLFDADVLLVRSVTQVDAALIGGTPVRFVGSATAGLDHINQAQLAAAQIHFTNAAGANARSVAEYVLAVLCCLQQRQICFGSRIGVAGAGNVGRAVLQLLSAIGYSVVAYDPFVDLGSIKQLKSLNELAACDVICLHTPLTGDTRYPTRAMINAQFLAALAPNTLLISAGRGGVVDEAALKPLLKARQLRYVADVWQGEPAIDAELLALAAIATPHIAGYSYDSKIKATEMLYKACCDYFGLGVVADSRDNETSLISADDKLAGPAQFNKLVLDVFDIAADDAALRCSGLSASGFDGLRANYRKRREFGCFRVVGLDASAAALASAAGFRLGSS